MQSRNYFIIATYFFVCLAIFLVIQKPLFLIYCCFHGDYDCSLGDIFQIYRHGLRLDLAATAYVTAIPLILLWIRLFAKRFNFALALKTYNAIISPVLAAVTVVDASLYVFWGFKLDTTIFMYIGDPKNAIASVSAWYVIARVLMFLAVSFAYYKLLCLPIKHFRFQNKWTKTNIAISVVGNLLLAGSLFGFIRGLDLWPNSPGVSFFSKVSFHNHAALNPFYNLIFSATQYEDFDGRYNFFDEQERSDLFAQLYPPTSPSDTTTIVISKQRPNIVVVLLESMGAYLIESLGGMPDVAPNLNKLCKEGVNFSRCYCSSFRTDRGIVSALSGYPGQPTSSIIRYPNKIQNLPGLPKVLKSLGYATQALYAGDATFFNMSGYFLSAGHDKMITQLDFKQSSAKTKWGIHDHEAFNWLFNDLQEKAKSGIPSYTTFLTISSHEPFDVPYHRLEDERLNAFAYTDDCLGKFVTKLKNSPAWENLLLIISSDHGDHFVHVDTPEYAHIPFIMLGGAIKQPEEFSQIISQNDLPAIVLGQLGIAHNEFIFSRDPLSSGYKHPFAVNTFNDGFSFFDNSGCTIFDCVSNSVVFGDNPHREALGKAFLQSLYDDLSHR